MRFKGLLKCFVTGKILKRAVFGIQVHHFIKKQHWDKSQNWFLSRGIKQRLIPLYYKVHADLHSGLSDKSFFERYKIERYKLLFDKDKYFEGYYDKS